MLSISALRPRGLTVYTASKGAVIALTKAIAVDHGPQGIRANCIAPGPVYTPMVYAHGMTDQARDTRRQASVLKREGTGWDIGSAARFLLSEQARTSPDRPWWWTVVPLSSGPPGHHRNRGHIIGRMQAAAGFVELAVR